MDGQTERMEEWIERLINAQAILYISTKLLHNALQTFRIHYKCAYRTVLFTTELKEDLTKCNHWREHKYPQVTG